MPIEIRIDVIPHGVEAARQQIGTVRIVQVKKFDDDPEGWRLYAVSGARSSHVRHRRDGAARLVALALAADQGLEVAGAGLRREQGE